MALAENSQKAGAGGRAQARTAGLMDTLATLAASGFSDISDIPRPHCSSEEGGKSGTPLLLGRGGRAESRQSLSRAMPVLCGASGLRYLGSSLKSIEWDSCCDPRVGN